MIFSVLWKSANVGMMSVRGRYIIISYLVLLILTTTTTTTATARELHHICKEAVAACLCKKIVKASHKALSDWLTFITAQWTGQHRRAGGQVVAGFHLYPSLLDNVLSD